MNDEPLRPWMTDAEVACFDRHLSCARTYVEFGSGGSTVLATNKAGVEHIWSVEGDPDWYATLTARDDIKGAIAAGRLHFAYVDLGPVGTFSRPTDPSTSGRWPAYYETPLSDRRARAADLFLIDGRFRVACALSVLMVCDRGAGIVVHDFWNRPHYHRILEFTDWVESAGKLAVLRPKPLAAHLKWRLSDALEHYRLDSA